MPLNTTETAKSLIHNLYNHPMSGDEIESRSMAIIDELADRGRFTDEQWLVAQRLVHTTADFGLLDSLRFSEDAVSVAVAALRAGSPIYVDSNMIRSGLSLARLKAVNPEYSADRILCHVADADVASQAKDSGLPRSLFAVRKAAAHLDGAIAAFGNAPVALLELNRMIVEDNIRPAVVIGMPVGFVHVIESKEELMSLDAPYIALAGRRGGSPLAVSVIHALCSAALSRSAA